MSLQQQQADLMAALAGNAAVPAGFDASRVQATRTALAAKRRQAVAHVWPALAQWLGPDYTAHFTRYASHVPLPAEGGPLADGRAFARWLAPTQTLSDAVAWQALGVDLRFAHSQRGLTPRRTPSLRLLRLPQARSWVLGLRVPRLGEWYWQSPKARAAAT